MYWFNGLFPYDLWNYFNERRHSYKKIYHCKINQEKTCSFQAVPTILEHVYGECISNYNYQRLKRVYDIENDDDL